MGSFDNVCVSIVDPAVKWVALITCVSIVDPSINPIAYAFFKRDIKQECKRLLFKWRR